jgi:hypothetical protein
VVSLATRQAPVETGPNHPPGFPGIRIPLKILQASIELGFLSFGERDVGCLRDTVPEILGQLDALSNRDARLARTRARGELRTTVITRFELRAGAKTSRQERVVSELLAGLPCLLLDEAGADAAAGIQRTLERGVGVLAWRTA